MNDNIGVARMFVGGGMISVGALFGLVAMISLVNIPAYTGMTKPELYLAHKVLKKAL